MNEVRIIKEMGEAYIASLKNLDVIHPRLLVLFSGAPGVGKTTIARKIESEFRGLRLENDAIRRMLKQDYPEMELEDISHLTYVIMQNSWDWLIENSVNGLFIIDAGIDRRYSLAEELARKHGFDSVLLAFEISDEEHEKRIRVRGAHPFASLDRILSFAQQRRQEQRDFLSQHVPDMIITHSTTNEQIFEIIKHHLLTRITPQRV